MANFMRNTSVQEDAEPFSSIYSVTASQARKSNSSSTAIEKERIIRKKVLTKQKPPKSPLSVQAEDTQIGKLAISSHEFQIHFSEEIHSRNTDIEFYDALILYSNNDLDKVKNLKEKLESWKLKVYLPDEFPGGRPIFKNLQDAFDRCSFVLVWLSKDFVKESRCQKNMDTSVIESLGDPDKQDFVVPIVDGMDEREIPLALKSISYIACESGHFPSALKDVVKPFLRLTREDKQRKKRYQERQILEERRMEQEILRLQQEIERKKRIKKHKQRLKELEKEKIETLELLDPKVDPTPDKGVGQQMQSMNPNTTKYATKAEKQPKGYRQMEKKCQKKGEQSVTAAGKEINQLPQPLNQREKSEHRQKSVTADTPMQKVDNVQDRQRKNDNHTDKEMNNSENAEQLHKLKIQENAEVKQNTNEIKSREENESYGNSGAGNDESVTPRDSRDTVYGKSNNLPKEQHLTQSNNSDSDRTSAIGKKEGIVEEGSTAEGKRDEERLEVKDQTEDDMTKNSKKEKNDIDEQDLKMKEASQQKDNDGDTTEEKNTVSVPQVQDQKGQEGEEPIDKTTEALKLMKIMFDPVKSFKDKLSWLHPLTSEIFIREAIKYATQTAAFTEKSPGIASKMTGHEQLSEMKLKDLLLGASIGKQATKLLTAEENEGQSLPSHMTSDIPHKRDEQFHGREKTTAEMPDSGAMIADPKKREKAGEYLRELLRIIDGETEQATKSSTREEKAVSDNAQSMKTKRCDATFSTSTERVGGSEKNQQTADIYSDFEKSKKDGLNQGEEASLIEKEDIKSDLPPGYFPPPNTGMGTAFESEQRPIIQHFYIQGGNVQIGNHNVIIHREQNVDKYDDDPVREEEMHTQQPDVKVKGHAPPAADVMSQVTENIGRDGENIELKSTESGKWEMKVAPLFSDSASDACMKIPLDDMNSENEFQSETDDVKLMKYHTLEDDKAGECEHPAKCTMQHIL